MIVRCDVWWDMVTLVGRMRYIQSHSMSPPTPSEAIELLAVTAAVDELLAAILGETAIDVVYPDIIQPVDSLTN